jgi:hypothetical protein
MSSPSRTASSANCPLRAARARLAPEHRLGVPGLQRQEMPDPKTWAASGPRRCTRRCVEPTGSPRQRLRRGRRPAEDATAQTDDDVQRDLQALFAIRDAAIADTVAGRPRRPDRRLPAHASRRRRPKK